VVRHRLSTSTTSVTYTAAQQIADWGAMLGPVDRIAVHIYQLSAPVGGGGGGQISTLTF